MQGQNIGPELLPSICVLTLGIDLIQLRVKFVYRSKMSISCLLRFMNAQRGMYVSRKRTNIFAICALRVLSNKLAIMFVFGSFH